MILTLEEALSCLTASAVNHVVCFSQRWSARERSWIVKYSLDLAGISLGWFSNKSFCWRLDLHNSERLLLMLTLAGLTTKLFLLLRHVLSSSMATTVINTKQEQPRAEAGIDLVAQNAEWLQTSCLNCQTVLQSVSYSIKQIQDSW